jgi:hypothetical protein
MQMRIALFAGFGCINISERDYNKQICKIMSQSPEGLCTYDPFSQTLHVKETNGSLYKLMHTARLCAKASEAFPALNHINPRQDLNLYCEKYL